MSGIFRPRRQQIMGLSLFLAGWVGTISSAGAVDLDQAEQEFRDVCSACHSVEVIFEGPRMTSQQWDYTIRDMVGRGADATDEQLEHIKTYLKSTWGSVWINMADASELILVLGLSEEDAESIIAYRDENGDFEDIESLQAVPDIDVSLLDVPTGVIVFN